MSPPHSLTKIVRMIVGIYEHREVHKRYNVVSNGPDSVGLLETFGVTFNPENVL